jgi:predicted transcriptional regulator
VTPLSATTTLKLPTELKERIAPLARKSGKTPHAWMVEALERQAALAEMREGFVQDALNSAAEVDAGGPLYAAEEVHSFILARASGKPAKRPRPAKRGRRH